MPTGWVQRLPNGTFTHVSLHDQPCILFTLHHADTQRTFGGMHQASCRALHVRVCLALSRPWQVPCVCIILPLTQRCCVSIKGKKTGMQQQMVCCEHCSTWSDRFLSVKRLSGPACLV